MTGPRDGRDDTITAIRGHVSDLGTALEARHARDDTGPCPEERRAANSVIDAAGAMLQALHAIRARLVSEIRISDDASAARMERLLARDPDDFPGPSGPGAIRSRGQRGRALGTPGRKEPERSGGKVTVASGAPIGAERQQVIPPEPGELP